jgi:hypothetical protein
LSIPTINSVGTTHLLTWTEGVTIKVNRISADSKHQVSGELLVQARMPGLAAPHLHQARLNMTSTTARNTLVKALTHRLESLAWADIVEQTCVKVLEAHRRGSPVLKLADVEDGVGVQWLLKPVIQRRQTSVLFGDADSGKSMIAAWWSLLLATGMPGPALIPEQSSGILVLDYETDEYTWRDRLVQICKGMDIAIPENIHYRYSSTPVADDIEDLADYVADLDIDCILIDSAAPAVGEALNGDDTINFFRSLRALGKTNLVIAHVAKEAKQHEIYGSGHWRTQSRANYRVYASRSADTPDLGVILKNTKGNNARRLKDLVYGIHFDENDSSISFKPGNVEDYAELDKTRTISQRLTSALKSGAKTTQELAEDMGADEQSIRTTLNRNKKQFTTFKDDGQSYWGITHRDH